MMMMMNKPSTRPSPKCGSSFPLIWCKNLPTIVTTPSPPISYSTKENVLRSLLSSSRPSNFPSTPPMFDSVPQLNGESLYLTGSFLLKMLLLPTKPRTLDRVYTSTLIGRKSPRFQRQMLIGFVKLFGTSFKSCVGFPIPIPIECGRRNVMKIRADGSLFPKVTMIWPSISL